MWLQRAFPLIAHSAVRSYYRVMVEGPAIPTSGPVLLIGNHNHSLVDPAAMVIAAGRPVRFLAKYPLFLMPSIAWLVKGVGAVPVYRIQDVPEKMGENVDSFRDAHHALGAGDIVGIYPEGTSHLGRQLVPLKTGAARIALGGAAKLAHPFPIIPVGLIIPDRVTVRSEAYVLIGAPVAWDDLVARGLQDGAVVRELTVRMEAALRTVTLNLPQGEDDPIVHAAEQVWRAEFGAAPGVAAERARLQRAADVLDAARRAGGDEWSALAHALEGHIATLASYGLTPLTLHPAAPIGAALAWSARRMPWLLALPVSLLAAIVFAVPTRIARGIADHMSHRDGMDAFATHRILVSFVAYLAWIPLVASMVAWLVGPWWGLSAVLAQPLLGILSIRVTDERRTTLAAIRRWVMQRRAAGRLGELQAAQRALAERLRALLERIAPT
jgi:glycerol-3-phosphate O-acyltransferase/dihydroxyacetone phosphate acyltransferase